MQLDLCAGKGTSANVKLCLHRGQLEKVKSEITRLEVGIKSAERDLKKSEDKCKAYEAEVAEAEEKMRQLKEKRDGLEASGQ